MLNRSFFYPVYLLLFISCGTNSNKPEQKVNKKHGVNQNLNSTSPKISQFSSQNTNDTLPSISHGSYSNGTLENGKLIPFSGKNFKYFSEASYLAGRAFLNAKVLKTLLDTYQELDSIYPDKMFYIMESSYKKGGKFYPHRTHQNGLSVDLMTPMLKDGKNYDGLDHLGIPHYWIQFDENGIYEKDNTISINLNLVAHHILLLDKHARKNGLKIYRVHFQNNLHDEFYKTDFGKEVRKKGIILTTGLSKTISEQHDDHFHVDFASI
jgi:penicillin-insensitive murein endopeptidase